MMRGRPVHHVLWLAAFLHAILFASVAAAQSVNDDGGGPAEDPPPPGVEFAGAALDRIGPLDEATSMAIADLRENLHRRLARIEADRRDAGRASGVVRKRFLAENPHISAPENQIGEDFGLWKASYKSVEARIEALHQFEADVAALLDSREADQWFSACRTAQRARFLTQMSGMLGFPTADLEKIIASLELDETTLAALSPVLQEYAGVWEASVASWEVTWNRKGNRSMLLVLERKRVPENLEKCDVELRRLSKEFMELECSILEMNFAFVLRIEQMLPSPHREVFRNAVIRHDVPALFCNSPVQVAVEAPQSQPGLPDAISTVLDAWVESYEARRTELRWAIGQALAEVNTCRFRDEVDQRRRNAERDGDHSLQELRQRLSNNSPLIAPVTAWRAGEIASLNELRVLLDQSGWGEIPPAAALAFSLASSDVD